MEFRSRQSEEPSIRHSPSPPPRPPSSEFFSAQAMKAGFDELEGTMRPKSSLEELERELQEEKIKQEIIARRIAQRRMIEEQVRREIEIDREIMASLHGTRFVEPVNEHLSTMVPEERFGPHLPHRGVELEERFRPHLRHREVEYEERFGPHLRHREFEFEERFGPHFARREVEFEERFGPHFARREVEFEERLMLSHSPKVEVGEKLPLNTVIPGTKTANEVKSANDKISGVKRKAAATSVIKFPQPAEKDWSCALCQVSATNEEGLNEHLKGKKHLTKAAALRLQKSSAEPKNSSSSNSSSVKKFVVQDEKLKLGGKKVHIRVNGKMHEVVERGFFLWCLLCKVKCNSKDNMATHICGKKHKVEEAKSSLKLQRLKKEEGEGTKGVKVEKPEGDDEVNLKEEQ